MRGLIGYREHERREGEDERDEMDPAVASALILNFVFTRVTHLLTCMLPYIGDD